ncbi:MAG: ETC complex I subunit [Geminicoccaceae bacterium]
MLVRIYRPAKTAVSQGRRKTHEWILEREPEMKKEADPLIGWVGSGDTDQQWQLRFPDRETAIAYAEKKGWQYRVAEPRERTIKPKSYSDNFIRRV